MAAKYIALAKDLMIEMRVMQQSSQLKLPSEAELCSKYSCSRQTVRSALALLEKKGLIIKKVGSGSFIVDSTSGLSREIALIIPDADEYIYPGIIKDIEKVISKKGYALRYYSTEGTSARERAFLSSLLENPPAGIIIEALNNCHTCPNEDLIMQIGSMEIPFLYIHCAYPFPREVACIAQDNFTGGYILAEHLASKGHKRIAGVMKCTDTRGIDRYDGCVQACSDLGLDFCEDNFFWFSSKDRKMILNGNNAPLYHFIDHYLDSCTAVICYNDEIAYHLIQALEDSSLRVPEDVAVVSFDDSYYCTAGSVGITSLGHGDRSTGIAAAEAMIKLISGQRCRDAALSWHLSHRQSD